MGFVERLYAAAAKAGLLKDCRWQPADGAAPQHHAVGFTAPDETVLDGLSLSTEYVMTYPASVLVGLAARETVEIDDQLFQVREIRAVGEGSERRATLSRI